jgi:hypothetical protein
MGPNRLTERIRELRPYANSSLGIDNEHMSMYAELLSRALQGETEDLHGDDLVGYALDRRAEMLAATGPIRGSTAFSVLAVEIAYDCALLKLCGENGIVREATDFSHPADDRHLLEIELKTAGVDLILLGRHRRSRQT